MKGDAAEMAKRKTVHENLRELENQAARLLNVDPNTASIASLSEMFGRLDPTSRKSLIAMTSSALQNERVRKEERFRVLAVRLIVAFVPDTSDSVRRLLQDARDRSSYELHFSIFCFLDDLQHIPRAK